MIVKYTGEEEKKPIIQIAFPYDKCVIQRLTKRLYLIRIVVSLSLLCQASIMHFESSSNVILNVNLYDQSWLLHQFKNTTNFFGTRVDRKQCSIFLHLIVQKAFDTDNKVPIFKIHILSEMKSFSDVRAFFILIASNSTKCMKLLKINWAHRSSVAELCIKCIWECCNSGGLPSCDVSSCMGSLQWRCHMCVPFGQICALLLMSAQSVPIICENCILVPAASFFIFFPLWHAFYCKVAASTSRIVCNTRFGFGSNLCYNSIHWEPKRC